MAALLQQPIQRKLSALLGADVAFDHLSLSLLGGSVEARGVRVSGADAGEPVLTIRRVKAEVAVARALKGEIVVRTLTIERPVLSVVVHPDGSTNLPRRIKVDDADDDDAADTLPAQDAANEPTASEPAQSSWRFDVEKVLVLDGEMSFVDRRHDAGGGGGYALAAAPVMAELKRCGGDSEGYEVTIIADKLARRDVAATLGDVRVTGLLSNARDLTALPAAGLEASVEIGELLKAKVTVPTIRTRQASARGNGALEAALLAALLPASLLPVALRGLVGRAEFTFAAEYDPRAGLRVPELVVRVTDVVTRLAGR